MSEGLKGSLTLVGLQEGCSLVEQGIKGVYDGGEVLDELLIEVAEAEERLNVLDVLRWPHILEFGHIVGVNGYPVTGNGVSQISEGGLDPLAFTRFYFEVCLPDLGKDLSEVVHMFF